MTYINKFSENMVNMKGPSGSLKETEQLLLHAVNYQLSKNAQTHVP
jgi:hypothetical protein